MDNDMVFPEDTSAVCVPSEPEGTYDNGQDDAFEASFLTMDLSTGEVVDSRTGTVL